MDEGSQMERFAMKLYVLQYHITRYAQCGTVWSILLERPLQMHPRVRVLRALDLKMTSNDVNELDAHELETVCSLLSLSLNSLFAAYVHANATF